MSKKNYNDDFNGSVIPRKSFIGRKISFICTSCGIVKDSTNNLHREFKTHKLYEWEVIGKKILCARCVCALFAPGNRRN